MTRDQHPLISSFFLAKASFSSILPRGLALVSCFAFMLPACTSQSSFDGSTAPNKPSGENAIQLIGSNNILSGGGSQGGAKIGVNALLWRAALDTISFIPLASADPFGGLIITEWHTEPTAPDERFKLTIYILDTDLRADALRVSYFRQIRSGDRWIDAEVSNGTQRQLEDAILTRARQMRIASTTED
jgi:hypothetical protein